jgi:hypothetical protein
MTRYLVVANQTLGAAHLLERLRAATAGRDASFYLVVPATPPLEGFTWTEGQARALASLRLRTALGRFHHAGLDVAGEVGDPDPMLAVEDALRHRRCDVIVLSTLPVGISRWLRVDLPQRMRGTFPQPVVHVVIEAGALVA